ncbi:hypothetical protein [Georgfuchsia toluolica]|uniref:hypothetical protein n=1 Tax=Georgfuchsia toluolica TaxID=424218 RepID=UPI001FEBC61C|nr:hypothetical protein [Georgfuchsia toluolica]
MKNIIAVMLAACSIPAWSQSAFVASAAKEAGAIASPSGLVYRSLKKGAGSAPVATDTAGYSLLDRGVQKMNRVAKPS